MAGHLVNQSAHSLVVHRLLPVAGYTGRLRRVDWLFEVVCPFAFDGRCCRHIAASAVATLFD